MKTKTMLVKTGHLEPWHISDDGRVALCGVVIKHVIDRVDNGDSAYGKFFCENCKKFVELRDEVKLTGAVFNEC